MELQAAEVSLGKRIAERRAQMGWSMNELARQAKLNPPTLQKIEQGKSADPSVSLIVAIAKALSTTVEALVEGEATPQAASGETGSLLPDGPIADTVLHMQRQINELERVVIDLVERQRPAESSPKPGRKGRRSA